MGSLGKKILTRIFVGLGIAMVHLFISIQFIEDEMVHVRALLKLIMVLSVIWSGYAVAALIYDIETWSPLKRTVVHFMTVMTIFYGVNIYAGFLPLEVSPLLVSVLIFTTIYFIIWLGMRWYWTRKIASMNANLRK